MEILRGDGSTTNTAWDSMFSQNYDPDGGVVRNNLFKLLRQSFKRVNNGYTGDAYNARSNAWEVEKEVKRNMRTRDILKQQLEEVLQLQTWWASMAWRSCHLD